MQNDRLVADDGDPRLPRTLPTGTVILAGLILVALTWAYWQPLGEMARKWWTDPQYSQGYVVPAFAAFLFWLRRHDLAGEKCRPNWWGAVLLASGVVLRLAGTVFYIDWVEAISLLPALWGSTVLLFGWQGLRHTWYATAFLFFMIPLPFRVETGLSQPLQRVATLSSTYTMQTLGFPAFAEGNVIVLNEERVGIVTACNGLGMLMLFFALAVGLAIVLDKPALDKVLIIAAAVPIAILANTLRITATTIFCDKVSRYWGNLIFHDYGGWMMMPLALGMLWVVVKLIDYILPTESRRLVPITPLHVGRLRTS